MSGTIRSRTEAQRDRHNWTTKNGQYVCKHCGHPWSFNTLTLTQRGCPDRVAADDTLTDLAALEERLRAMIDYLECAGDPPCVKGGSVGYCDECAVRWDTEAVLAVLVSDPDSRGAA